MIKPTRNTFAEKEIFSVPIESVSEGIPDTSVNFSGDNTCLDDATISALWEHAIRNDPKVKKYILCNVDIDNEYDDMGNIDDIRGELMHQLLDNLRGEKKILFSELNYEEDKVAECQCIVVKFECIDNYGNEHICLEYIAFFKDIVGNYKKKYTVRNIIIENTNSVKCQKVAKLANPTDRLALVHKSVEKGMAIMLQNNIPVWVFSDYLLIDEIIISPVYKIEIYFFKSLSEEIIEEIALKLKDKCHILEIGQWNYGLKDFEWYIDDPDMNYIEIVDHDYFEKETEDYVDLVMESEYPAKAQSVIMAKKKSFDEYLEIAELPDGYIVTKNGVWIERKNENGKLKKERISHTGVLVVALARTERQSQWMSLIVWVDLDGQLQEGLFPSESLTSSKDCISQLQSRGCKFPFGQDLEIKAYLSRFHTSARYRLVTKTGFYTGPDGSQHFALPAQIIGNQSGEEIYFQLKFLT